jgi:hypothetical protein
MGLKKSWAVPRLDQMSLCGVKREAVSVLGVSQTDGGYVKGLRSGGRRRYEGSSMVVVDSGIWRSFGDFRL